MNETAMSQDAQFTAPELEQAALYLEALTGSRNAPVTWCLLHDKKAQGQRPVHLYGTLEQHTKRLGALNRGGYGVFVTVNAVKPNARRTRDNVEALRALFVESDDGAMPEPLLAPSFRVQSARGEHVYWALQQGESLALFETAQKHLAAFFGSDPVVHDLPRLMRVPGFLHQKSAPFLVRFVPGDGARHTISDILRVHPVSADLLKASKKASKNTGAPSGQAWPASIAPQDLPSMQDRKTRAEAYLQRVPAAVEGAGGDCQTFKAACIVVRDFAVDNFADAMDVLRSWNAGCTPPWEERELAEKVSSALRNGKGSYGSKLTPSTRGKTPVVPSAANGDWDKMAASFDVEAPAKTPRALTPSSTHTGDALVDEPVPPQSAETFPDTAAPSTAVDHATEGDECCPPELADADALGNASIEDLEAATAAYEASLSSEDGANDDNPFSIQLVEMLAMDASRALGDDVVETLARLHKDDPQEYSRCLFEIKNAGPGLINEVKRAVKEKRLEAAKKANDAKVDESSVAVCEALPTARGVVGHDHRVPYGYELEWSGVTAFVKKEGLHGPELVEVPVCDRPVVIKTILDKVDGAGSLLEVAFRTRDTGKWHTVTAPRDVFMTARLLTTLALYRFPVHSGNASQLVEYLAKYETVNEKVILRKKAAVQMGWQGEDREFGFLVGRKQILPRGTKAQPVEFAADSEGDTLLAESFRQKGTAEAWMDALLTATRYPRVYLAVLASLAAPLLDLLELDNFFVDYSGETSGGKTTTLRVAASVWGSASHRKYSLLRSWNTTVAGMERTASTLSGLPLFIDESNEAQSPLERQALAKMIYQLGNGRGRTRATRSAGTQPLRHWSTIVLSSGEHPITTATQDAGTRARVLAMEDSPFGGVSDTASMHIRMLNSAIAHNYGHAGPMFVEWLMQRLDQVPDWIKRHQELATSYATDPEVPQGVAERLGRHLALLDLTGELMAKAFQMPLGYKSPVRECLPKVMESAQQADRPKDALLDVVSRVNSTSARLFGEANHDPAMGVIGKRSVNCEGVECLAVTGAFVREVLMDLGHNPYRITRSWLMRGYLVPGADGKHQRVVKLGGAVRCCCIRHDVVDGLLNNAP